MGCAIDKSQDNGKNLTFEQAMYFLRQGCSITRSSFEDAWCKILSGTNTDEVYESFYMTIFDVLAEDWMVVDYEMGR